MSIKRGSIALNAAGEIGLILSDGFEAVTHFAGGNYLAYTGVHLGEGKVGRRWVARFPYVVGVINDVEAFLSAVLPSVNRPTPSVIFQEFDGSLKAMVELPDLELAQHADFVVVLNNDVDAGAVEVTVLKNRRGNIGRFSAPIPRLDAIGIDIESNRRRQNFLFRRRRDVSVDDNGNHNFNALPYGIGWRGKIDE